MRRGATRRRGHTGQEPYLFDPLPAERAAARGGSGDGDGDTSNPRSRASAGATPSPQRRQSAPAAPAMTQLLAIPEARRAAPLELMRLGVDAVQTPRDSSSSSFARKEGLRDRSPDVGRRRGAHRGVALASLAGGSECRRPASILAAVAAADAAAAADAEAAVVAKDGQVATEVRATSAPETRWTPDEPLTEADCPLPARVMWGQTAPDGRHWLARPSLGEQSMPDLYSLELECRRAQESLVAVRKGRATE